MRGGRRVGRTGIAVATPAPVRLCPDGPLRPIGADGGARPDAVALLRKYDRPGPRYTSYPTAMEFTTAFDERAYRAHLAEAARRPADPLSLYLHLPFCESRCSFCGCLVVVTKKREVAARYLDALRREIRLLAAALRDRRRVVQYHWGGGTPTYLEPAQLQSLHRAVAAEFVLDPGAEMAIEIDPRVTTCEQVDLLRALGFNRLSMGVQDFTPEVQAAINRHQSRMQTRALFEYARRAGFGSINVDLVYGLPLQTPPAFAGTLDAVIELRPERIAVYSYAHVPWLRGNQRRIDPNALPSPALKLALFELAADRLVAAGYRQIGMDHFALPQDELAVATAQGRLHRTFMGYTTRAAPDLVGLGLSAIGDVAGAYAQNAKKLSAYYAALDQGRFAVERGHRRDRDDEIRRHVITQLMCHFRVDSVEVSRRFGVSFDTYFAQELAELGSADGPAGDGLVSVGPDGVRILPRGRLFVRSICMVFDRYLRADRAGRSLFSRTV